MDLKAITLSKKKKPIAKSYITYDCIYKHCSKRTSVFPSDCVQEEERQSQSYSVQGYDKRVLGDEVTVLYPDYGVVFGQLNNWKQPGCPREMTKKTMTYLYIKVLLSNTVEELTHPTIWMNLKNAYERSKMPDTKQSLTYGPIYLKF